jgi:hypothetical protein
MPAGRPRDDLLCLVARDGRALAWADSHGTWLHWVPDEQTSHQAAQQASEQTSQPAGQRAEETA